MNNINCCSFYDVYEGFRTKYQRYCIHTGQAIVNDCVHMAVQLDK